jgi:hypothetical protein
VQVHPSLYQNGWEAGTTQRANCTCAGPPTTRAVGGAKIVNDTPYSHGAQGDEVAQPALFYAQLGEPRTWKANPPTPTGVHVKEESAFYKIVLAYASVGANTIFHNHDSHEQEEADCNG